MDETDSYKPAFGSVFNNFVDKIIRKTVAASLAADKIILSIDKSIKFKYSALNGKEISALNLA